VAVPIVNTVVGAVNAGVSLGSHEPVHVLPLTDQPPEIVMPSWMAMDPDDG
jgi:hypothetical protein